MNKILEVSKNPECIPFLTGSTCGASNAPPLLNSTSQSLPPVQPTTLVPT